MPSMPKIPRSQNRTPSWRLRMNGSPHLRVTSPGIAEDERFLLTHTGRGDDVSPELRINGLTDDVARLAFAVTFFDVAAGLHGVDDGSVGAWPANAKIFKLLYQ